MKDQDVRYILEWQTPDGDFCYGYKTLKKLHQVLDTFKGKPYIHYKCYKVILSQELLFNN